MTKPSSTKRPQTPPTPTSSEEYKFPISRESPLKSPFARDVGLKRVPSLDPVDQKASMSRGDIASKANAISAVLGECMKKNCLSELLRQLSSNFEPISLDSTERIYIAEYPITLYDSPSRNRKVTNLHLVKVGYASRGFKHRKSKANNDDILVELDLVNEFRKDPASSQSMKDVIETDIRLRLGWSVQRITVDGYSLGREFILMTHETFELLQSKSLSDTGEVLIAMLKHRHHHIYNYPSVYIDGRSDRIPVKEWLRFRWKNQTPGVLNRRRCVSCKDLSRDQFKVKHGFVMQFEEESE